MELYWTVQPLEYPSLKPGPVGPTQGVSSRATSPQRRLPTTSTHRTRPPSGSRAHCYCPQLPPCSHCPRSPHSVPPCSPVPASAPCGLCQPLVWPSCSTLLSLPLQVHSRPPPALPWPSQCSHIDLTVSKEPWLSPARLSTSQFPKANPSLWLPTFRSRSLCPLEQGPSTHPLLPGSLGVSL